MPRVRSADRVDPADRDALDVDRQGQRKRRRQRGRTTAGAKLEANSGSRERSHRQSARQQRARRPRQVHVVGDYLPALVGVSDSRDVHLPGQRTGGAFEHEAACAATRGLADRPVEAALAGGEPERRAEQHAGDERHQCKSNAQITPERHQNVSPIERCNRTCLLSWPYATSTRNGPIGVRTRTPTP